MSARGQHEKAEIAVNTPIVRTPQYPTSISLTRHIVDVVQSKPSFWSLFDSRNLRATDLRRGPWFILVNYEYALVSTHQPGHASADAIRRLLLWSIAADGGNQPKYLNAVGFIPLPDFIRAMSEKQIGRIQ